MVVIEHPVITQEEKERRIEEIKKAIINMTKGEQKNGENND